MDRIEPISRILGPLDAQACRGFVPALDMEFHAFAAVSVPGAISILAWAVLFEFCHA